MSDDHGGSSPSKMTKAQHHHQRSSSFLRIRTWKSASATPAAPKSLIQTSSRVAACPKSASTIVRGITTSGADSSEQQRGAHAQRTAQQVHRSGISGGVWVGVSGGLVAYENR